MVKKVMDTEKVQVTNHAGVQKVRVPAKWRGILKAFLKNPELEMSLVMEDGVPHLELRHVPKEAQN